MSWWPTVPSWLYGDPRFLVRPASKLTEMLAPSNQPTRTVQWSGTPSLGAWMRSPGHGGGLGAPPAAGQPAFTDPSGNAISSAVCGNPYGFTVPGYETAHGGPGQVYIVQTKNGQPQYAGMFSVPMAPYTGICGQDEGTYQLAAYDPVTGNLIGQTTFMVLPAGTIPTGVPSTFPPAGGTGPTHVTGSGSFNLNTTTILALAAGAYLLFSRRRG